MTPPSGLARLADDRPTALAQLDLEVLHGLPLPPGWTYLEAEPGPEFVLAGPGRRPHMTAHGLDPREVVRAAWTAWEGQFDAEDLRDGPPLPLPPGWRILAPPAGPLGLGVDLYGQACVIARELGLSAYRVRGPAGDVVAGRVPDVVAAAWQRHQQRLQDAKRRAAVRVAGVAAVLGLAVVFVLAALGCDPAVGLAEPWYTAIMTTSPRILLVPIAALLLCVMHACADDPATNDNGIPEICKEQELPLTTLEVFEPCLSHDQCRDGVCLNGFCAEPCAEDNDCIRFGYMPHHEPSCENIASAGKSGCYYFCLASTLDCPDMLGLPMKCEVPSEPLPSGIVNEYVCMADVTCESTSDTR